MSDTRGGFGGEDVVRRGLEKLHGRGVFEGWRVQDVDNDGRAGQDLGEAVAGDRVYSRATRRGDDLAAVSRQQRDQPGSDESAAADDNNLHTTPVTRTA